MFGKDKKLNLCLEVMVTDEEDVVYCGVNIGSESEDNRWLDQEGKWFEVKVCECFTYKIEDGLLKGPNVVHTKTGSKVKGNNGIEDIIAIILHRTAGSTIAGAISHSKGTHFYVQGSRDTDGEIFQPIKLDQYSNHIMNQTARTARLEIQTENSIGIEVIGMAYFEKGGKYYTDTKIPQEVDISKFNITKAYDGNHYWDSLTDNQIKSVVCIVKTLMKEYNLSKSDILTHESIQSKTAGEGQAVYDAIISKI